MMLNLNCTDVFYANYSAKEKIVINQGGTSSSKTYSLCQLLFLKAIEEHGAIITITGESIPNLKKGAYRDAQTIYSTNSEIERYVLSWNKSDRIFIFKNGSIIEFVSNLDEQSAKNGKRDYLFVNEANGIDWQIFFQLAIRTRKQIFIDYNPSAPFWAHDNLIGKNENDLSASVRLIISDHRHNNFLSADDHRKIEGIKDKELWRVYARGLTGNLEGIIYPNWKEISDDKYPTSVDPFGGLDFGYTNDPTAIIKTARIGNSIYLHELAYEAGMGEMRIKELLFASGFTNSTPVYCDHDPDMISALRRLKVMALPARKGQGSVKAGIMKMKEYDVYYTASSKNIAEERKRYMWMKDPKTGKAINEPIDAHNHTMDASRYAVYTHLYK